MPSAPTKTAAAAKPAAAKAAAKPKSNPAQAGTAAKTPKPEASKPTAGAAMRPRDLIARVAEATGAKPKDLRPVMEAMLDQLGKSLDAGETLNLPPLGKMWLMPVKADAGAAASTGPMKLKLRRGAGSQGKKDADKEALAVTGQDS